jgi:hypothetical protein
MESALVKTTVLLIFLGISVNIYTQNKIEISGYVYDGSSGGKLAGASVSVINNKKGIFTDSAGYFSFNAPPGKLHIVVRYLGYTTKELNHYILKDTFFTVPLVQENRLNEITVIGNKKDISARSNGMSIIDIPVSQIKKAPNLLGEADILKFIQLMPGVQSTGDGNVGLYIRGGGYDQNMIIMDGAPIYRPEHLKGFISAMNSDMIDRVTLYKGAFPSIYGSRLSGVVDMEVKKGNDQSYHGSLNIGMLSAKLFFEGPIIKNRLSFAISARRSLYNLITKHYLKTFYDNPEELTQFANIYFYDLHAKINYKISDKDNLSLNIYNGKDVMNSDGEETSITDKIQKNTYIYSKINNTDNNWINNVTGLSWKHKYNKRIESNIMLNYSGFRYFLYNSVITSNTQKDSLNKTYYFKKHTESTKYYSEIQDLSLSKDLIFNISPKNILTAGIKLITQYFNPTVHAYDIMFTQTLTTESDSFVENIQGETLNMNTYSFYLEDEADITNNIKLNAGTRFTLYSIPGKTYNLIEPRLGLRVLLGRDLSVKFAYTTMSQAIHLLSSSNLVMPSDIWIPVSKSVSPMKSDLYSTGFFYDYRKKYSISIEGYYKKMYNLLEYKDGVSYLNSSDGWENMVAVGKGSAFGVELFIQKVSGNTTGSFSFTHSYAFRKFDRTDNVLNFGKRFFAKNDCRNNISLNFSHVVSKHFDLSALFIYKTGMRTTLSDLVLFGRVLIEYTKLAYPYSGYPNLVYYPYSTGLNLTTAYLTSYSEKNGYKLPDYHRLDLGLNFHIYHKKAKSNISLTLYNIYNHFNINSVYSVYENNHHELKGICLFPFMPSLSYSYEF